MSKAYRLRALAIQAYWAAKTPLEAKMAGVLLDVFAPGMSNDPADVPDCWTGSAGVNGKRYLWMRAPQAPSRVGAR